MNSVSVICNRCGQGVEGAADEIATSGFYCVEASPWQKYRRARETVVCDRCMWESPEYQADYGHTTQGDEEIIIHVEGYRR